jgi:hypothetical protein
MSSPSSTIVGLIGASSLLVMLSGCGSDSACAGGNCASAAGGATSTQTGGTSAIATGGATSVGSGGTVSSVSGGVPSSSAGGVTSGAGASAVISGGTTSGGAASGGANDTSGGATSVPAGGTSAVAAGGTSATVTGGTVSVGGSVTTATGGTATEPMGGATSGNAGGTLSTGGAEAATGGTSEVSTGGADAGLPGNEVILKYDFEDGTGTTVTDVSGNGNNGTLVSASWTAAMEGRNGIAAQFANTDSAVALPNDLFAGANELTVSSWVFLTDNQAWNHLFDFGTGTETDLYFTLNNSSGGMELGVRSNGSAPQTLFTTTMLPLNMWKHVAITLSSQGAFIYVDGREVARAPGLVVSPSVLGVTTSNWIGKSQFPYPEFNGRLDEFYVYNRALTRPEIAQLAWPKTDYSIWHFDETSGTVAHDSSDNARDGTLINATWTGGVFGGAIQLYNPGAVSTPSASDQYVQLPNGILENCTQGYTVAGWISITAVYTHQRIFNFGNDAGNFIAARTMGEMTQQLALVNRTDGTERYAYINSIWTAGIWYHVATVRNGQTLLVYLNGSTTGVASAVNSVVDAMPTADRLGHTLYNYIGKAMPTATDSRFHGLVDEFLVSCRPFTADEIMQLAYRPPS